MQQMNELHIKYRSETGEPATKEYDWASLIEELDYPGIHSKNIPTEEYVKWLEE